MDDSIRSTLNVEERHHFRYAPAKLLGIRSWTQYTGIHVTLLWHPVGYCLSFVCKSLLPFATICSDNIGCESYCITQLQGGPKSKPLSNYRKFVLNRIKVW